VLTGGLAIVLSLLLAVYDEIGFSLHAVVAPRAGHHVRSGCGAGVGVHAEQSRIFPGAPRSRLALQHLLGGQRAHRRAQRVVERRQHYLSAELARRHGQLLAGGQGLTGMRWSETICSAAWRVLVATEPYDMHARDRFVPPS
jgi:hypothetical protein